jgi:hypothetical protein
MDKNLQTSFVMGLWSRDKKKLFIFSDYTAPNPYPSTTVLNLTASVRACSSNSKRDLKNFEWYGNSLMFSKKDNMQSEYRRRGIHIREAVNYNEYSAISRVATFIKYDAIKIHSRCEDLIRQMNDWTVSDRPLMKADEIDEFGLCRSLSLMASMLFETGKMRPPEKKIQPYSKASQKCQKQLEAVARSGKMEDFLVNSTAPYSSGNNDSWMGI